MKHFGNICTINVLEEFATYFKIPNIFKKLKNLFSKIWKKQLIFFLRFRIWHQNNEPNRLQFDKTLKQTPKTSNRILNAFFFQMKKMEKQKNIYKLLRTDI